MFVIYKIPFFFLFPDAPTTEAVKRKVESDIVDGVEESAETPEKKSKLSDENIATVEAEATA